MSQTTPSVEQSTGDTLQSNTLRDRDLSSTANLAKNLPDHTQLPDKDGNFVKNYQEPPQGDLLTDCITPITLPLRVLRP